MTAYAVNLQQPTSDRKPQKHKRAEPASYDPIAERSKIVADKAWERASAIAAVLAPEVPSDQQEVDDEMQWLLLSRVAVNLSPHVWDDPDAIEDFYRLVRMFSPEAEQVWGFLPAVARLRRTEKKNMPDPGVTPQSPEWEQMQRRLK